jgi:hypothetical protein
MELRSTANCTQRYDRSSSITLPNSALTIISLLPCVYCGFPALTQATPLLHHNTNTKSPCIEEKARLHCPTNALIEYLKHQVIKTEFTYREQAVCVSRRRCREAASRRLSEECLHPTDDTTKSATEQAPGTRRRTHVFSLLPWFRDMPTTSALSTCPLSLPNTSGGITSHTYTSDTGLSETHD